MQRRPSLSPVLATVLVTVLATALIGGCTGGPRQLMPTPTLYQLPRGQPMFETIPAARQQPDQDLLFLTDRAAPTATELQAHGLNPPPYGEQRARRIAFGSAEVRVVPGLDWATLREQSQLAERTRAVNLELGQVRELAAFPEEPYGVKRTADGTVRHDRAVLARHDEARDQLETEVQRRLADSPSKEVLLYLHGFNETFESAAFTAAELCHFLGREHLCAFFTWPAASTGNFLTAYITTTESADFAVEHLKRSIRMLASTPGVEGIHLLAHSRGTAVTLKAVRELALETIAAGQEPADQFRIRNLVLLSPDIDVDLAAQQISSFISDPDLATLWPAGRLPRVLAGPLTVYASPADRALLVSRILFRSRGRVGQLRPEDIPADRQRYMAKLGRLHVITYEGKRTDFFGHSYFTSNPRVSSDLIQLIRYRKQPGEPGRELVRTGPITWRFPDHGAGT